AMSDMFCGFWVAGGMYHMLRYWQTSEGRPLFLAVLFSFLAILTRYPALLILIIPIIYSAIHFFRNFNWKHLAIVLPIPLLFILPELLFKDNSVALKADWFAGIGPGNLFRKSFETEFGTMAYTVPNIMYGFSPFAHAGFLSMGLPLLWFLKREDVGRMALRIMLAGALFYVGFLMLIPHQNQRFFIPVFPIALLLFYPAFNRAWDTFKEQPWLPKIGLGVLLTAQISMFAWSFRTFYNLSHLEQSVSAALHEEAAELPVYAFFIDPSMESYDVPQSVHNLFMETYTEFPTPALVVFHPGQFQAQWTGTPLMDNWNRMQTEYVLTETKAFRDGWKMYRLTDKKEGTGG
ncbi:MAG: hypothetical protein AAF570_16585, partial [Bacteroidota bacterium]